MKSRIKVILYFLLEFLLSVVILGVVGLGLLKSTLYNQDYVKKQFEKADYYNVLYTSINEEMSNIIVQAGLDESALEDIYTKEMLTEAIDNIITSVYNGKEYQVDTKEVKENLENNINKYLEKNNIKITDQAALDKFVNNILKIYQDEITLSNHISKIERIISKTKNLINIGFIVFLIIGVILFVFIKGYSKEIVLSVPFIVSGIILIFGYLLVNSNIVISNFYIWDTKVSTLLQEVMYGILGKIKLSGIVFIIIGCLDVFIINVIREMKRK